MKTCIALACALALTGSVGAQSLVITGPITGPQQPQTPTGNGLIEGTVINEVTREPVRKAQVTLGSANAPPAITDATGHFVFRNLAPGTYWPQALHALFPQPTSVMQARPFSLTLGQDEQKHDLVIALTPGAWISGTVSDEDGKPLAGCSVQALEFQLGQPERRLNARNSGTSDSRGQYRIGLPSGRYYLMVQCGQTLPAPHPLIRMGPDVDLPQQRYTLEFYPGPPNASGAGRFTLAAGADSRGIDFQVRVTATVTVRGRFSGDLEALRNNPGVLLVSRDPLIGNFFQFGGAMDTRRNTFRIHAVPPGRYTLIAFAQADGHAYQAKMPVDIGTETPAPIELAFPSGSSFTGSIEAAGDQPTTLENAQVRLMSMDSPFFGQEAPFAKVEKDRTFALSGVMPGRWRLQVENSAGYVKSLIVGDRQVSPHGFNIGAGSGGVMRILLGAKSAQIDGTVIGTKPEGATNLWLLAAPDDPDRLTEASTLTSVEGGHFTLAGIEPGKYRLYAFAGIEPSAMQQNPGVLKALEGRGVEVDLEEGAKATPEVPIIPIGELLQAIQEQE